MSWTEECRTIGVLAETSASNPHCFHLPVKCKILFYKLYILPLFMYAAVSWCGLSSVLAERLEIHHRKLLRILFRLPPLYSSASLYALANACPLSTHHQKLICTFAHKFKLALHPPHISVYNWFRNTDGSQTRCSVALPLAKTSSRVHSTLCCLLCLACAARYYAQCQHPGRIHHHLRKKGRGKSPCQGEA